MTRALASFFLVLLLSGCLYAKTDYMPPVTPVSPASAPAMEVSEDAARIPLWPLFLQSPLEGGGYRRSILWPFFHQTRAPQLRQTAIVPIFARAVAINPNNTMSTITWTPLTIFIKNSEPLDPAMPLEPLYRESGLWPLYRAMKYGEGQSGMRGLLFSIFRYGWSADEGRYIQLWPLPRIPMGGGMAVSQ